MKLQVFSVFDSAVQAYDRPFFARTVGEAMRSWEQVVNDGQSPMSNHPADFTLFHLGEFDQATGVFSPLPAHARISSGVEAKRQPQAEAPLFANVGGAAPLKRSGSDRPSHGLAQA